MLAKILPLFLSVTVSCLSYVSIPLSYSQGLYFVSSLKAGTPRQQLDQVVFDTGSSDLVVTTNSFHYNDSSSLVWSNKTYPFQYGSSDLFEVRAANDTISLGEGVDLTNFTFALAQDDVESLGSIGGVLGVGLIEAEALLRESYPRDSGYPNFPVKLHEQGVTSSTLFSLYGKPSGPSVVFGGIDAAAYDGPLYKTPITRLITSNGPSKTYAFCDVTVNEITLSINNKPVTISNQNLLTTLDTGNNGWITTQPIYDNLFNSFIDTKTIDDTVFIFLEELKTAKVTFDVTGFEVSMPLTDIIDETDPSGDYASLMVAPATIGEDVYASFIPNAIYQYVYTVFDYDNHQILLAPYSGTSGTSEIVPVDAGEPFAVATTTKPQVTNTYSQLYQDGLETTISVRSLSTATPTNPHGSCRRKQT